MASGIATEIATFGGYTFAFGFHEAAGLGLMVFGLGMATCHAQDIKVLRCFSISLGEWSIFSKDLKPCLIPSAIPGLVGID